jgi:hypothetical protein
LVLRSFRQCAGSAAPNVVLAPERDLDALEPLRRVTESGGHGWPFVLGLPFGREALERRGKKLGVVLEHGVDDLDVAPHGGIARAWEFATESDEPTHDRSAATGEVGAGFSAEGLEEGFGDLLEADGLVDDASQLGRGAPIGGLAGWRVRRARWMLMARAPRASSWPCGGRTARPRQARGQPDRRSPRCAQARRPAQSRGCPSSAPFASLQRKKAISARAAVREDRPPRQSLIWTRTALSARNATRGLANTIEKAQLPGVTFHALRHTFASILIAQGRDPAFVADQLGHENPAFTWRTYVHLFRAAQQAATAREPLDTDFGHLIGGA